MNTTLHRSITHPPDTEDREVLQIPRPDELRRLSLADRLSLRIGLWLFQRAQRPRRERRTRSVDAEALLRLKQQRLRAEADASVHMVYDLQRGLR
ncbi:hypothetical protein [Microbacterium oxydans]|uniref:hypothetical protein n=1 Tax=Microbacterium oxydans TaxID=82380 RepID=UPI00226B2CB6|nr:hypothetical protein [Microbacterium oxydans]WAA67749.1 hypothetical protein MME74_08345 [Microbacterium oxydans]